MDERHKGPGKVRRFRRGASILPSLFTTGNLFLGFWSIIRTLEGQFEIAAALIGGAIVLDMLDGRIARLTGTSSEFGAQLDSLADAISFGVAPALLAFRWALDELPRVGWLAAFWFAMCGVLRLARFNVQRHVSDMRYFVGLPIPAAAGQVATLVYFHPDPVADRVGTLAVMWGLIVVAVFMVSTFRYRSFKGIDLRARRSYINVLGIAALFLLVAARPEVTLLAMASIYTLSGPTAYLSSLVRRRSDPPPAVATGAVH